MSRKVLVSGATGAMGQYLVPRLAALGYEITGLTIDDTVSTLPNMRYLKKDAYDADGMQAFLQQEKFDGIVDFMIYNTAQNPRFLPMMLDHTDHYIYLSSYRVYSSNELPIRENSPQWLDCAEDLPFRHSDDYSVYKARGEHFVRASARKNWSIIRPAITYSRMRYQLVTLEMINTVARAKAGKKVVLPAQAKEIPATMTWAGDVAQMIATILFNGKALCEDYSVCTAEHRTWGEIADYYKDICGLEAVWVDKEDYLAIVAPDPYQRFHARWQLEYDRLQPRIMDNRKILDLCNLQQKDLMPLYDGLKYEIGRCPADLNLPSHERMDEYLKQHNL